jgi:hypothetical protein
MIGLPISLLLALILPKLAAMGLCLWGIWANRQPS